MFMEYFFKMEHKLFSLFFVRGEKNVVVKFVAEIEFLTGLFLELRIMRNLVIMKVRAGERQPLVV